MRVLIIALAILLSSCTMADGKVYYLMTADEYHGRFLRGAYESCLYAAAEDMLSWGLLPTRPNAVAVAVMCRNISQRLLREEDPALEHPIPMPTPKKEQTAGTL